MKHTEEYLKQELSALRLRYRHFIDEFSQALIRRGYTLSEINEAFNELELNEDSLDDPTTRRDPPLS